MSEASLVLDPGASNTLPSANNSLGQNPAAVYLATLRPSGKRTMKQSLEVIAATFSNGELDALGFPWHSLRYQHSQALRAALAEEYKPATVNKMLAAYRRVLKEAWNLGLMDSEDYRRASQVSDIRGETLPRGRALGGGELAALMRACADDESAAGARDAALIAVLYTAGLRRSEAVRLELADYNLEDNQLVIRAGKGNKDRTTYINEGAAAALADWLAIRGQEAGPLFQPVNKGGKVQAGHGLTDQVILKVLRKRGNQAGLQSFSPHDLRRTFISDLLDAGADIATVQRLAGHSNVTTTSRYDRRGEVAKRKAVKLLHLPYTQRKSKFN